MYSYSDAKKNGKLSSDSSSFLYGESEERKKKKIKTERVLISSLLVLRLKVSNNCEETTAPQAKRVRVTEKKPTFIALNSDLSQTST